jgi:hypothetical protein
MTKESTPDTLSTLRSQARELLNEFDAADGLASYYALYHANRRTVLYTHFDTTGVVDGFLARCQTGIDLFRPLVTLRIRGANDPVSPLIESALVAGRPYLMVFPAALRDQVGEAVALSDSVCNRIMRLESSRFQPDLNTLVVTRTDAEGHPRAEIARGDRVIAQAGVNWRSPIFAEVYVKVEPEGRGHGWGQSVVRAVSTELLKIRVTPLYAVAEDNDASYDLALDVGFVDTGAREIMAQGIRG